jgi:transposase InsO family protein
MNIVDDFSGFHWTRMLKLKSDTFHAFRDWVPGAETQSGQRLCYVVTDNGELRSNEMAHWCTEKGVTHLFTAPYTSLQNGKVERLHRTLMNKARAMRLACNAPLNMWDEFMLTSSFLSNLTTSKSANGKTPHELWFDRKPNLSHLREIGCKAYVLIPTNNPKIAARSIECVLIGYTPNSKAYRCWHRESGRIFDSYHVTFVEHLDLTIPPPNSITDSPPVPTTSTNDNTLTVTPPAPPPLRRSACPHAIAPSREETDDGLRHGRAMTRALEQIRAAAQRSHTGHTDHPEKDDADVATALTVDVDSPDDVTVPVDRGSK